MVELNISLQNSKGLSRWLKSKHLARIADEFASYERINAKVRAHVDEDLPGRKYSFQIGQFRFIAFAEGKYELSGAPALRGERDPHTPPGQFYERLRL